MFQVGDTVVKSSIGICKIKAIRILEIEDRTEDYYLIQAGDVDVLVPRKLADHGAIRRPMTEELLQEVYSILESSFRPFTINHSEDLPQEYLVTPAEMKTIVRKRDPMELTALVRTLYNKELDYMLDKKETEFYATALNMLIEEISYLEKSTKGRMKAKVNKMLSTGRKEGRRLQAAEDL